MWRYGTRGKHQAVGFSQPRPSPSRGPHASISHSQLLKHLRWGFSYPLWKGTVVRWYFHCTGCWRRQGKRKWFMGRATRTECHCQKWAKNKNKMRESCWHAQAWSSFTQIKNVRQLELSITPPLQWRAEVLNVVSCVASINVTLLTRVDDPRLSGRACRLGV